jgi:hypothetical protein
MDSRDQVILAGRLNAALLAAGLEIVSQKREGGRMTIVEAEPVSVVGWLFRGNFLLRETGSTVLPHRLRLLAIGGEE